MMNKSRSGLMMSSLYRMIYADILVCLCLFGAGSYFGIQKSSIQYLLTAFLVILIFTALNYFKFRGRIVLLAAIVGGFFITIMVTGFQDSWLVVENYLGWLTRKGQWQEAWLGIYELFQAGFIAIFCYLFEMISERQAMIRRVTGVLLLLGLCICLVKKIPLTHSGVVFCICYILLIYIEWIQSGWTKIKESNTKSYMLWIMPFIVIYLVVMCLMPAPEKPYEWKYVKKMYQKIVETITVIGQELMRNGGEDFGISMSGFSEEGALKGNIWDSNMEVMTIRGQSELMTNIYLNGKVFDTFDGQAWVQNNQSTEEDRLLDTLETLYAVERYEGNFVRNYLFSTTIQIKYQYFKTGYLFAPLKSIHIKKRSTDVEYDTLGGNLLWDKKMGLDTEYNAQFYQMNVDHPEFYEFLETSLPENEEVWADLRSYNKYQDGSYVERSDLDAHKERIYQNYLHEIELSDEMKAYLDEITKDAETDIDRLKSIEKALSSMTYTRNMGDLPSAVDSPSELLDYLLLEKGEGYCTYFATAFILLAWEEGIPARYVQGFCVPMNGHKSAVVTSDMAHAWPEVYIENVGWIPFEPTPGYAQIRYTPWEMQESSGSDESMVAGAGAGAHYWEEDNIPEPSAPPELPEPEKRDYRQVAAIAGYTILLILLLCAVVMLIDGLVGKYNYKHKSLSEKFRTQVIRNLRILAHLGYERKDAETLQEFRERAHDTDLLFLQYYEEMLYGHGIATEQMLEEALEERNKLLGYLKEKKQKAYLIYRAELYILRYR